MRKQQKIWEEEHRRHVLLPTTDSSDPVSGIVSFVSFLKNRSIKPPLKIIDIGCGKGRNAIYLAKLGFEVHGMDYVQFALDYVEKAAKKNGVVDRIQLYNTDIDKKWPFKNNLFDIAIDSFSSIDVETKTGRQVYKKEMLRTLKPSGYVLVMVVSINDEMERDFIEKYPGKEKNSTLWPGSGKFQKDYDEQELKNFYKEFKIIELYEVKKPAFKLGRHYTATNYWMVLRK